MVRSMKPVLIAIVAMFIAAGCKPGMSTVTNATDQSELSKIALESTEWEVRKAAAEKLTDQASLAMIAVDDENQRVRAAAIDKMTGQAYLAFVALRTIHESDRAAADRKITDQVVLSNYIQQVRDANLIEAILKDRLTSQTLIAWLALNAPTANLRDAATRKVNDYDIFEAVAAASPSKWAGKAERPTLVRENHQALTAKSE